MFAQHAQRLPDTELPKGYPLLLYKDNTTFFMEGSVEEARDLSTLLDLFPDFASLQINWAKSAFVGFGLTQEDKKQCLEALGTPIGSLPMRYLGLPQKKGRLIRLEWQPVIEKVERRLGGGKQSFCQGVGDWCCTVEYLQQSLFFIYIFSNCL